MAKYRKKPIVIDAIQWNGGNIEEVVGFLQDAHYEMRFEWDYILIKTLEGDMKAEEGDWIIKGIKNEFYPCKNDIFEKSYELVND